jgi:hypothetical protein
VGLGAKGTAAAKSGFIATWLAPLTPFLGIAAGAGAQCLLIRNTTTDRRVRAKRMAEVIICWVVAIGLAWGGEITVRFLANHFDWSGRTLFIMLAGFWWLYCCALIGCMCLMAGRGMSFRLTSELADDASQSGKEPMKPWLLAMVVAGIHLALFSPMIRVAWIAEDLLGAWSLAGAVVILCALAFFRLRGKTGAAAAQAGNGHLAVCSAVLLVALNLRIDVWVASAYGVTVAEAHRLQPLWIVPLLTLAFVVWAGMIGATTKRKLPPAQE